MLLYLVQCETRDDQVLKMFCSVAMQDSCRLFDLDFPFGAADLTVERKRRKYLISFSVDGLLPPVAERTHI